MDGHRIKTLKVLYYKVKIIIQIKIKKGQNDKKKAFLATSLISLHLDAFQIIPIISQIIILILNKVTVGSLTGIFGNVITALGKGAGAATGDWYFFNFLKINKINIIKRLIIRHFCSDLYD